MTAAARRAELNEAELNSLTRFACSTGSSRGATGRHGEGRGGGRVKVLSLCILKDVLKSTTWLLSEAAKRHVDQSMVDVKITVVALLY